MKALLSLLITLTIAAITASAQDAHLSQFYANPVNLNPSLAGMSGLYRAGAAFRSQGKGEYSSLTSLFSVDAPMGTSSGWSLIAINDSRMGGVLNTTSMVAGLAHVIEV